VSVDSALLFFYKNTIHSGSGSVCKRPSNTKEEMIEALIVQENDFICAEIDMINAKRTRMDRMFMVVLFILYCSKMLLSVCGLNIRYYFYWSNEKMVAQP
jgi:hypothetical protein